MTRKRNGADPLFPLGDRATLIKLTIASYLGFLLVWVFGFKATAGISISAIMTLPYGSTVTNTRSYVGKRMLAQVVGVAVAYPLYLFFNWVPRLHASQRMALPMTLSLLITALINRKLRWKIPDITMLIPGYLVILMTPGYDLYPIMRPIYVLLGITIGYGLNVFLFAPHYGRIVEDALRQAETSLCQSMEDYRSGTPIDGAHAHIQTAEQQLELVRTCLPRLKQDGPRCKKYASYLEQIPGMERRFLADEALMLMLRQGTPQGDNSFAQAYDEALQRLFDSHQALLRGEEPSHSPVTCPVGAEPGHIPPMARLLNNMERLLCISEKAK